MPMRDNPHFIAPSDENIDTEFTRGIEAEVREEVRAAVRAAVREDTCIHVNGESLPVPTITDDTQLQMVFNFLAMCECCVRHQTNRPAAFNQWEETPIRKHLRLEACEDPEKCRCQCRHRMRFIARR